MKNSAYKIKLFFTTCLLIFVLIPLSGCKKMGWCVCECGYITMYEENTEEECLKKAKDTGCDCEWSD